MLNIIKNTINRVFASGVDSDASAFITATGLSGTTQKSAITNLVKDLKSSGLWSKMKAVYPMVTDSRNLLSYTEDFSNAFWVKSNANVSLNASTAPNGTNTANSIIPTTNNAFHLVTSPYSLTTTSNTVVYSGYFKPNGYNYVSILVPNNGGLSKYFEGIFNISTGNIEPTSRASTYTGTRSIVSVGNGWYRCSITITNADLNSTHGAWIVPMSTNDPSAGYPGNGTSGIYAWGAQFELSSTASTYQPILTTPAAFMASQMKYNLKDARDLDAAFRLTWSGGWTYSATGAKDNGINGTANTNFLASSNFTDGNYSFGVYGRTELDGSYTPIGISGTGLFQLYPRFGNTSYYDAIYPARVSAANTSSLGLFYLSRNTTSQMIGYKNGKNVGTSTVTTPSISGTNVLIGRSSAYELAFAYMSNSLSDTDAMLLNQIVEKYQVALSRGVQAAQSFYYNSAYSNEANTYLYSTQITGTTQVSAIITLINGLKANYLWAKMIAVYPFVTDKINYLGYTEDVTNAVWGKNISATTAANTTTSPTGTLTADTIGNTGNTNSIYQLAVSSSASLTYTTSIYIKQKTNRYFKLCLTGASGANQRYAVVFDMSNGTFVNELNTSTQLTNKSYSIIDAGNGWYRASVTATVPATSEVYLTIECTNSTSTTINTSSLDYHSPTVGECYVWGGQLELGTSASVYQPVLGANNYSTNVAAQMKFNLVNPQDSDAAFRLAFSGGWTYSTNGAQPNGTNGYADTKLAPSTNFSANNSSFSFYSRTENTNGGDVMGTASASANRCFMYIRYSTNQSQINHNSNTPLAPTAPTSLGIFLSSRTALGHRYFVNNALSASNASLETGLSTVPFYIGADNTSGTATAYTNRQVAFSHIGDGLSDAEAALLYQLVQEYQTTLSRQV